MLSCPRCAGFTASLCPCTTYSLIPSLAYSDAPRRHGVDAKLVSFSVNNNSGDAVANHPPLSVVGSFNSMTEGVLEQRRICGFGSPGIHDQVFRNQIVGSTCNVAGSGPRLTTVMRTRMSSARRLGIFNEDIEIAIVVEHAGIEKFEFAVGLALSPGSHLRDAA